jgi:hypothetical protein
MTGSLPMTPGRWVALVVGTPLALLVIGWTALSAVAWAGLGSYQFNLAMPVHGPAVAVSVDEGDVSVGPGPAGRLRVHGTLRYSLVRPQLRWQRSPSTIALHSHCRVPTGLCSFAYAVTVPAGGRSEVSNASGNVTASGLAGTVTLSTDSGDIHATRISGSATIADHSGDITVSSLSAGRALIMNDSGNITGRGVSSQVLTARDQSGDITLAFTAVPRQVRISDSSGNVKLVLPPGPTHYRISASSSSGQTSINVPQSATSPHVVSVTDQSGNITITR